MKKSNLPFLSPGIGKMADEARKQGAKFKSFDWDKAAEIIKEKLKLHPDLKAEAGLQGDWVYTGGVIFEDGKPVTDNYTYLGSLWATPTLILSWDGIEQEEIGVFTTEGRFDEKSKWDETSLNILNS